jgi:hypothetical protein
MSYEPAYAEMLQQNEQLRQALKEAIAAVKLFHGPGWELYRDHSPEMKRWKALLPPQDRDV